MIIPKISKVDRLEEKQTANEEVGNRKTIASVHCKSVKQKGCVSCVDKVYNKSRDSVCGNHYHCNAVTFDFPIEVSVSSLAHLTD